MRLLPSRPPERSLAASGIEGSLAAQLASGAIAGRRARELHEEATRLGGTPDLETLLCRGLIRGFTPFDYQLGVVKAVLGRFRGRAILADEVGLGKTIEAGMILLEYMARRLVKRCLVLVPPSLVGQWGTELVTRFGLLPALSDEQEFLSAGEDAWRERPLIVASLALAKREPHRSRILATHFDMVVVDEAHHLRNERTQAFKLAAGTAPHNVARAGPLSSETQ
jgi:superfamily II DNA or RNA helicase